MNGCHHCKHFYTYIFHDDYGRHENNLISWDCRKNHFFHTFSITHVDTKDFRNCLSNGDNCKDFEEIK